MRNKFQRYIGILIGILFIFSITGCTKNDLDSAEINVVSFQKPLFLELVNAQENQSYELKETILENYLDIRYPQLVKIKSVDNEATQINCLIEGQLKTVLSELGYFNEYEEAEKEDLSPSLSVIYEVKTFNQKFLSVQYNAIYSNIKMPHPITHCFTLNLNLETEQYIYLDDMIIVNGDFWKEFQLTAKPMNVSNNEEKWIGVYYPPQTSEGVKKLKYCDSTDLTQNTHTIFSYYEHSKLYLCFPKEYALGSYGIFEMELKHKQYENDE